MAAPVDPHSPLVTSHVVQRGLLVAGLLLTSVRPLAAQQSSPIASAPNLAPDTSPACTAPEFRQLDFWVGKWEVRNLKTGQLAGTNVIEIINRGCGLRERWTGVKGMVGTSLNTYDVGRRRWHQTWIDSDSLLLQLDGAMQDGGMSMSGDVVTSAGERQLHRIRWQPDSAKHALH